MGPYNLQRLAIQGVLHRHRAFPVGQVDDVVGDVNAVGVDEGAVAPRAEELAVPIEDHDRGIFALEGVDPVLGIGGDGADHAEGLPGGKLGPVLDQGVGVLTCAYCGHLVTSSW